MIDCVVNQIELKNNEDFKPNHVNTIAECVDILNLDNEFLFTKDYLPEPQIKEISFNNFKSFGEKLQTIQIKPITLIYAPNSIGKSSFQHAIVLLHYFAKNHLIKKDVSIEKIDRFGDEIDLGGFRNYVHKHDMNRTIKYIIKIDDYRLPFLRAKEKEKDIKKYLLFYNFYNELNEKLVLLFKKVIQQELLKYNLEIDELIEYIEGFERNSKSINEVENEFYFILKKIILEILRDYDIKDDEFIKVFKNKLKKYIKYEKIFKTKKSLTIKYFINLDFHQSIYEIDDKIFFNYKSGDDIDEEIKKILSKFDEIIFSKEIQYIGPLRFYPERNYNLDHLNDKSSYSSKDMWRLLLKRKTLREELNSFLSNRNKLKSNYHINIINNRILFKDLRNDTLVTHKDIGLGISQVLPILISSLFSRNKTIMIEQPELHLHPAVQAELGDEIIKSYKRGNNSFFIETHSEYLLLRIMRRIRYTHEKKNENELLNILSKDISLLYIDSDEIKTYILELKLSEKGRLLDRWPGGFFEEGFKERFL